MADIRKRVGKKGVTYQVRYPSNATKSRYAFASFNTLKEAREFLESGKARNKRDIRHSEIKTVPQAIEMWLEIAEKEGRDDRSPVSPSTLDNYKWRSTTMKAYCWDRDLRDLQEADVIAFRSWLKRNCTGLSPFIHPVGSRVRSLFEPIRLGDATGRGAEPRDSSSAPSRCFAGPLSMA